MIGNLRRNGKPFPFQSAEFKSLATGNSKQFSFWAIIILKSLKFLINNNLTFIIGMGNFSRKKGWHTLPGAFATE